MSTPTPVPVDGWTAMKTKVAAVVVVVGQLLTAAAALGLPDPWNKWVGIALQVSTALGVVVGVYQAPNKPIVAGQPVDGAYVVTTAP